MKKSIRQPTKYTESRNIQYKGRKNILDTIISIGEVHAHKRCLRKRAGEHETCSINK